MFFVRMIVLYGGGGLLSIGIEEKTCVLTFYNGENLSSVDCQEGRRRTTVDQMEDEGLDGSSLEASIIDDSDRLRTCLPMGDDDGEDGDADADVQQQQQRSFDDTAPKSNAKRLCVTPRNVGSSSMTLTLTLASLPERILHEILGYLTVSQLSNVMFTCKKLLKSADNPKLWRSAFFNSGFAKRDPLELTLLWQVRCKTNEMNVLL